MENIKILDLHCKIDANDAQLLTFLPCMLLELHAFKVLFYAESEGVVTSYHMTTMAVTPFGQP